MGAYDLPGPGDEITWGPCTNHPNDPRTPDAPDVDLDDLYCCLETVRLWLNQAEIALDRNDEDAALEYLKEARAALE